MERGLPIPSSLGYRRLLFTLVLCYKLEKSGHSFLAGALFCFQAPVWFVWPVFLGIYIMFNQRKGGYRNVLDTSQISRQKRQELEQLNLKQVKIKTPCPRICKAYALLSDFDIILVRINRVTASVQRLPGPNPFYQDEFGNRCSLGPGESVRMEHMAIKDGYLGGTPISETRL